jgi:uncharacterized metal-binding protein YceD (DUF177 family)
VTVDADGAGPAPRPELPRPVATHRITAGETAFEVIASPAECAAIALRLGIVAVGSLHCRFALRRGDDAARGEIVAAGVLRARVVQDCVVSLDPFEADVAEDFRVGFVHAGTETDDLDPEADDEIPYQGETIDLGEAAVEQLALALDPYPRSPGAELPAELAPDRVSPFAALARRARDS